jgi:hypothetical protein
MDSGTCNRCLRVASTGIQFIEREIGHDVNPLSFEPNPKHGPQSRGTAKGVSSAGPKDGQTALDNSVQIRPSSPRRVGVDRANSEIVVLDEHLPDRFHGHVRTWDDLTVQMQKALKDAGLVDKQGRIL